MIQPRIVRAGPPIYSSLIATCDQCERRATVYSVSGIWMLAYLWCGDCVVKFWLDLGNQIAQADSGSPIAGLPAPVQELE